VTPTEIATDIKSFFERGAQLLESHVPSLVEDAQKAESDPLVQAALSLVVPPATRTMLATLLKSVEADVQRIESESTANAAAAAAAAANPEPAPAEPVPA
jgi:hypothetical protein